MPIGILISLFFIAVSFITFISSVLFLIQPLDSRFSAIRTLTRASIYAMVLGFFSGMVFPLKSAVINAGNEGVVRVTGHFMDGVIESFVPVIIGVTFLSLSWLAAALGIERKRNAAR